VPKFRSINFDWNVRVKRADVYRARAGAPRHLPWRHSAQWHSVQCHSTDQIMQHSVSNVIMVCVVFLIVIMNVLLLNVGFFILCWVSLCWMLLFWLSLCWEVCFYLHRWLSLYLMLQYWKLFFCHTDYRCTDCRYSVPCFHAVVRLNVIVRRVVAPWVGAVSVAGIHLGSTTIAIHPCEALALF